MGTINMVSAPIVAKERGIKVDEVKQSRRGAYETYMRLTVKTADYERSVAGTVFTDGKPRIIQVKGIELRDGAGQKGVRECAEFFGEVDLLVHCWAALPRRLPAALP